MTQCLGAARQRLSGGELEAVQYVLKHIVADLVVQDVFEAPSVLEVMEDDAALALEESSFRIPRSLVSSVGRPRRFC